MSNAISFRRQFVATATAAFMACSVVPPAFAFDLPPVCAEQSPIVAPASESLAALRVRVEQLIETDPQAAVATICGTIPRVERERGADSIEMAWWVGSLGTPLIAFMDRFDEAVPLLEFARPIYEHRLGPYAAELAEIHVAYAWIATRRGRNVEAVAEWKEALRIRERTPGARDIELQKALVGLAQSESKVRDFAAAKGHLARAEAILVANGESVSDAAAAIENTYINIAWREEDYAAVRDHALKQIGIEQKMSSPAAQRVPAYVWLGNSLERLDEFDSAEAALRKALEIAESREGAPLQRHEFAALTQLAGLLVARGRPDEARELAARAVAVGEATRGAEAPALVQPLTWLGESLRALGELPAALRTHERAGRIAAAHPGDVERPVLVAHYRALARVQLQLGERSAAAASLDLAVRESGDDPKLSVERAETLLALAGAASDDAARAAAAQAQALAQLRSRLPDSHPAVLRAITDACVRETRENPAQASSCDEAAARVERTPGADPLLRHDVYAATSQRAAASGDEATALDLAIRALSAATTLGTPDPLWRADYELARRLRARNEPQLSVFFGKRSLDAIESLRGRFVGEDRQLDRGFLHDKIAVYRAVSDWLMEAGRIDEGLDVLRLLKQEEFDGFTLREARAADPPGGIGLTTQERELLAEYEALLQADAGAGREIDRLSRLEAAGRIDAAEREQLRRLLAGQRQPEASRAARIGQFLADAARPAPAAGAERRAVAVRQLAREIESRGDDTAVAVYLLTDTRLRILVATKLGQFEHEIPVDARQLRTSIGRFLGDISRRADVDDPARSLYALLAKPVDDDARRAGARRLVLWLDDALRYVPFAALNDGRSWLVDRYVIESYAPLAQRPPAATTHSALRVRGLGLTRAVGGFEPLPAMADEICDVVRGPIEGLDRPGRGCPRAGVGGGALVGAGFVDAAFTADRLRAVLGETRAFSVLHVGTHFSLRPGNANRSYLVLGDGERLTLDAIGALDFSGLSLVTLSACQSGLGGASGGDGREIEGLSEIVRRRGAQHVVASLWRVEDSSTARLMRALYAELAANGGDAAAALRAAQRSVRTQRNGLSRTHAHPFYWAGLLVSGDRAH